MTKKIYLETFKKYPGSLHFSVLVNTNSSSISFFRLDKYYGPREYDPSNKTLPRTQTSPLYTADNASQNFLLNEHFVTLQQNI